MRDNAEMNGGAARAAGFEAAGTDVGAPAGDGRGWTPPPPAAPQTPPPAGGWTPPASAPGGWVPPAPAPGGGWTPPSPPPGWMPPADAGGPGMPPHGRRPHRALTVVAAVLAGILLVGGGTGIGWSLARALLPSSAAHSPIGALPQIGSALGRDARSMDATAVAAKVSPAVVDVNTVVAGINGSGRAAGTGMILTSDGEVLTNNHVVQGATQIEVSIAGQSRHQAKVIGVDPSADVALLQVEGVSGLPTVKLADSSSLQVGQQVVAIGNALGQGGAPTVTTGTITGLDRSITASDGASREQLSGLLQTDASISPGDSGGPLVNAAGQVVGMITAGESRGRRATTTNVGYAIPSNIALDVVNRIRSGQSGSGVIQGQPGYLGVAVQNLDPATAAQLGLNVTSGALVAGVVAGSPAALAGIARYAVITAVDGAGIASADALGPAIQSHKPGDSIQVSWVDRSGAHSASVTLASGPAA